MSGKYIDYYIDPSTLDYVFDEDTGGFKMLENTAVAARQRLYTRLSTWQGEWFWNTDFGVDYKNSVLIHGVTKSQLDAIFLDAIYDEDLVEEVDSYTSELDRTTRSYTFTAKILVTNDDIINEVSVLPTDEWSYTYSESSLVSSCILEYIEESNKLYIYVNTTMPLTKQWAITWN